MNLEETVLFVNLVENSLRMKDVQISYTKHLGSRFSNNWLEYMKTLSEKSVSLERVDFSGFSFYQEHGQFVFESLLTNQEVYRSLQTLILDDCPTWWDCMTH